MEKNQFRANRENDSEEILVGGMREFTDKDKGYNKAQVVEETNKKANMENPFSRRDVLARTPPRGRASSLSALERQAKLDYMDGVEERTTKRKRTEGELEPALDRHMADRLKNTIGEIHAQARHLENALTGMYKPKQELKDIANRLLLHTEQLQSLKFQTFIDNMKAVTERQIAEINGSHPVYCQECKKAQYTDLRKARIAQEESFEELQSITEEEWLGDILPKIVEKTGNIWDAPAEYQVVLPCGKDIDSGNKIISKAIYKFGGREGLQRQNKAKGEVAMMSHTLGFPKEDGSFSHTERFIYYPVIVNEEPDKGIDDEDIYNAFQRIKSHIVQSDKSKLAIPICDGIDGVIIDRTTRYIFARTTIQVSFYNAQVQKPRSSRTTDKPSGNTGEDRAKRPKNKQNKGDAVLVKMQGCSYADLLRTIKGKVNPSEIGVDLAGVRQTRKGELLLMVQNGSDKAEILRQEIKDKCPAATATSPIEKKVLHIKGLDGVTTTEEIAAAISRETLANPGTLEVRALRPAYGGKQNATVILPSMFADKLIQMAKIKIGWMKCRVEERVRDVKCFKCWELGHIKANCKGPDRRNLCLRCAKEGHIVSTCPNEPFCIHCQQEGHQSGSGKCLTTKTSRDAPSKNKEENGNIGALQNRDGAIPNK
ncbi:hypothetical protein QE152_g22363 [Popillia japonica]|uniref:CCHC-type domain-containing protein n=1 Tax=Popillia japonica TaxID=7064 RepID=A0AAW1KL46_POPJA